MKTKQLVTTLAGVALLAGTLGACSGDGTNDTAATSAVPDTTVATTEAPHDPATAAPSEYPDIAALPTGELTAAETEALLFMREEEKLAHDVYVALGELWDIRIFDNIARSETSHMNAVLELLDRYDLEDPALAPGEFTNQDLQNLYDELVALGSQSLVDALVVGATIEDVDIADLEQQIEQTDNEDIAFVFGNLLAGSENHLRAFIRQLDRNGGEYQPQYLTQQRFDEILSSGGAGNA